MSDDGQIELPQKSAADTDSVKTLDSRLERAVVRLEKSRAFAKGAVVPQVLEVCRRLMSLSGGVERLYQWTPRLDEAGLFLGTDWQNPQILLAELVSNTLDCGDRQSVLIECVSQLRTLAIANGLFHRPGYSSEQARHYLTQVLAHNLNRIFPSASPESARIRNKGLNDIIGHHFHYLVDHIGYEDILGSLTTEIWRILGERPIQVYNAKSMVTQIAITLSWGEASLGDARLTADRLISALFGPTQGCRDDPGTDTYRSRLAALDFQALQQEAWGFARAMHDVGLVSDYHAVFLRWLVEQGRTELIGDALGLSNTALDGLRCYSDLVHRLIEEAIFPETAQSIYGLALLLERGLLYMPPIGPALWRQMSLRLSEMAAAALVRVFGTSLPPRVFLIAGVISVLGQPLGVAQGNNPTCQSARAISMWSFNDPDYLLHLVAQVAQFDSILMHFEGIPLHSSEVAMDIPWSVPVDNDPVSTLLVPHLDRIYHHMGTLCAGRGEDPHRWINPEFHGWWVGRKFAIAVDIATGKLRDYDDFIRCFYAGYHPLYNGNQPMIHPQPAGLAVTDSAAQFVGWHAITLQRVALDQNGVMRVYFYNPNNDSGQNWGNGVQVSTQHNGERHGEASLPFVELASRLYIFHTEPLSAQPAGVIPEEEIARVRTLAVDSWGRDRADEAGA